MVKFPTERLYGLGFLSKAFGLWYANVETCCGVTQWGNPAIKLHSNFGHLQVLTAYTPVHTHAHTLTYRSYVNPEVWGLFFKKQQDPNFYKMYEKCDFTLDPHSEQSMRDFHSKIMQKDASFFLSGSDVARKSLEEALEVYCPKNHPQEKSV